MLDNDIDNADEIKTDENKITLFSKCLNYHLFQANVLILSLFLVIIAGVVLISYCITVHPDRFYIRRLSQHVEFYHFWKYPIQTGKIFTIPTWTNRYCDISYVTVNYSYTCTCKFKFAAACKSFIKSNKQSDRLRKRSFNYDMPT